MFCPECDDGELFENVDGDLECDECGELFEDCDNQEDLELIDPEAE